MLAIRRAGAALSGQPVRVVGNSRGKNVTAAEADGTEVLGVCRTAVFVGRLFVSWPIGRLTSATNGFRLRSPLFYELPSSEFAIPVREIVKVRRVGLIFQWGAILHLTTHEPVGLWGPRVICTLGQVNRVEPLIERDRRRFLWRIQLLKSDAGTAHRR